VAGIGAQTPVASRAAETGDGGRRSGMLWRVLGWGKRRGDAGGSRGY
jgi:hypothetical protein